MKAIHNNHRKEIDAFVSQKVPIDDDYYYDAYGIDKPEDYDKLKKEFDERASASLGYQTSALASAPLSHPFPERSRRERSQKEHSLSERSRREQQQDLNTTEIPMKLRFIDRIFSHLADFFDHAPKRF